MVAVRCFIRPAQFLSISRGHVVPSGQNGFGRRVAVDYGHSPLWIPAEHQFRWVKTGKPIDEYEDHDGQVPGVQPDQRSPRYSQTSTGDLAGSTIDESASRR